MWHWMTVDYKNYKSVFQYPQSTFCVGFVYLKRTHTYLLKSWRFTFDLSCYMYFLATSSNSHSTGDV